jgi:hexosaminidase
MEQDAGPHMTRRSAVLSAAASAALVLPRSSASPAVGEDQPIVTIIPAPRDVRFSGREAPCTIMSSSAIVAGDPSLQPVADWLREQTDRLASIPLAEGEGTGPTIELVLVPDLSTEISTSGVRADDEDPRRELHSIEISEGGVRITGRTAEAVFRGATSLLHLLVHAADNSAATLEALSIIDAPRYAWRGLSLDVVRAFHPVETVKKVIDVLALYKMNVLHMHLTDSEGWRFDVPDYPDLTAIAGKTAAGDRPGGYYTQDDYAEILDYASSRHITVVPEFDSPAHTASVLRAYPELGTPEMHAAADSMQFLDPANPAVWDLVEAVYREMARVHPGARLHVGGDEALSMDEETFAAYLETSLPMARATGKGIVAWQETSRAGFSDGDLMQLWIPDFFVNRVQTAVDEEGETWIDRSFPDPEVREAFIRLFLQAPDDVPKALAGGADVIISLADKLYLDTRYPEPSADPAQEDQHQSIGLPPSVYGNGTVQEAYDWDPETIEPDLPPERIAGIEGAIWCETIEDEDGLLFQLLPRLPGVAEKGWSDLHAWDQYVPRLASQRHIWDTMGLSYFLSSVVWQPEDSATPVATPLATPRATPQ